MIAVVGVIFVRANLPTLLEVSPASGETQVDPHRPLILTFSEAMQPDSVAQNLEIQPPKTGNFTWEAATLTFTPDQPWGRGEQITVTLQAGARSTLGLPLLRDQIWSFQISPPMMVYLWPFDGPADLYAIDLIGGTSLRLTETPNGVLTYSLDQAGTHIFYSTRLNTQNSAIFRLDRASGRAAKILTCQNVLCNFPQLSPNGDFLTYTRAPSTAGSEPFLQQIWLLPFVDGEPAPESRATLVSDPNHAVGTPFWSPTSLLTFYDSEIHAFLALNPQTQEQITFPNETGEPGTWAPDGSNYIVQEIVFWGSGPLDYSSHLWRFEYPSGQSTELTTERTLEDATPSYASDGRIVAFSRKFLDKERWIPGRQLWLINNDGSNPRQLTSNSDFNHADFAWHPNGEYLAFVRYNQTKITEPPEIWIIQPNGSNALRLVIGGYVPQWIP